MNKPIIPRFTKTEFTKNVITKDSFKEFKVKNPEFSKMKIEEFRRIWRSITDKICQDIVYNPLGVKLPHYLGELKCQYLPYNFEAINPKILKDTGEKVPHLNIITKDKVAKIKWERRRAVTSNTSLQFYGFDPHREITTLANKHITENPEKVRISRVTVKGHSIWRQYEQDKKQRHNL